MRKSDEKGNEIGAQPGHAKHTRAPYPPEALSDVHEYASMGCPHCCAPDIEWAEELPPRIVQQSELKEIAVTREEHRAHAYRCAGCERIHYAEFPRRSSAKGCSRLA